jgi:hypothetical protein
MVTQYIMEKQYIVPHIMFSKKLHWRYNEEVGVNVGREVQPEAATTSGARGDNREWP